MIEANRTGLSQIQLTMCMIEANRTGLSQIQLKA